VLLWFVGPAVLIVWAVFSSPGADYRFVALGAVVPLLELPVGSPRLLHSLAGAAAVLVVVMVGARGRRLVQRRLLGVPIGMLLHLVLDGTWTDDRAFWWPFRGTAWSTARLPELGRGPLDVVLELVGAGAIWWAWRQFGFADAGRRRAFLATGRLPAAPRNR
jgi:hypothetical protein